MVALSLPASAAASAAAAQVAVWLELSAPPVAASPLPDAGERHRRLQAVRAQQAALAEHLPALGAVETGRVQLSRNAVAVQAPATALEALGRLPGVVAVRPLVHRQSIHAQ